MKDIRLVIPIVLFILAITIYVLLISWSPVTEPKINELCLESETKTILVPVTTIINNMPIVNLIPMEQTTCLEFKR